MASITKQELLYRIALFLLALETQIQLQITAIINTPTLASLSRWKYLTNQANLLGIIWLGFWIYWRNDPDKLKKLKGKYHGAVVSYLTLVMIAYHFLLSSTDQTFWTYTNISLHYLAPTGFLVGWLIWEREEYEWSYLKEWVIFPIFYAVFALSLGATGIDPSYVYGFLNADENGWSTTLLFVLMIFIGYLLIAAILIGITKKISNHAEKN